MNTTQINSYLSSLFNRKRVCFNVIPSDYLDSIDIPYYPLCLVVNSEDSSSSGRHWIAFFRQDVNSDLIFFCSYGMGIESYSSYFINFAKRLNAKIIQNTKTLQSINSNVCGQYTIYFLYKMYYGCCLMSLYCSFSSNMRMNDSKVKNFVKRFKRINYNVKPNCVNQCCKLFK